METEPIGPLYSVLAPLLCEEGADITRERYPQWDVNSIAPESRSGDSYFLLACIKGDLRVAKAMMQLGANIAAKSTKMSNCTALMCACLGNQKERGELIKWLLQHAEVLASIDDTDRILNGWTALHYAVAYSHKEVVRMLLCYGMDHTVRNEEGKSPADVVTYPVTTGNEHLINNWIPIEEWRPWTHEMTPRKFRNSIRTLVLLAKISYL